MAPAMEGRDGPPGVPPSAFRTGFSCRCPRCGRGAVFRGFLTVVERCAVCGLPLAVNDSADGPAVFLSFILGTVGVAVALWVGFTFDVAPWVPVAVASFVIVLLVGVLLRPVKAYVLALQFRHRRQDFEAPPR